MESQKKENQQAKSDQGSNSNDQIEKTRKRLSEQKKALEKIIRQFSKKAKDK